MPKFVMTCDGDCLDLAFATKFVPHAPDDSTRRKRRPGEWLAVTTNGARTECNDEAFGEAGITRNEKIIPAGALMFGVTLWIDENLQTRPTIEDVQKDRNILVGWIITNDNGLPEVTPLFTKPVCEGETGLIENGDGTLSRPDGPVYASLAEAKADVLATEQQKWDQRHGSPPPPASHSGGEHA